jgi:hypothetical protein
MRTSDSMLLLNNITNIFNFRLLPAKKNKTGINGESYLKKSFKICVHYTVLLGTLNKKNNTSIRLWNKILAVAPKEIDHFEDLSSDSKRT